jgi:hypothetical protein
MRRVFLMFLGMAFLLSPFRVNATVYVDTAALESVLSDVSLSELVANRYVYLTLGSIAVGYLVYRFLDDNQTAQVSQQVAEDSVFSDFLQSIDAQYVGVLENYNSTTHCGYLFGQKCCWGSSVSLSSSWYCVPGSSYPQKNVVIEKDGSLYVPVLNYESVCNNWSGGYAYGQGYALTCSAEYSFPDELAVPDEVVSADSVPSDNATVIDLSDAVSHTPTSSSVAIPVDVATDSDTTDANTTPDANATSFPTAQSIAQAIDQQISQDVSNVQAPSLPAVPTFDSNVTAPTPPNIVQKILSFVNVIDFQNRIQTSFTGYCDFDSTVSMWGMSVPLHIDFCKYQSQIEQIGNILLAVVSAMSLLIIFGV